MGTSGLGVCGSPPCTFSAGTVTTTAPGDIAFVTAVQDNGNGTQSVGNAPAWTLLGQDAGGDGAEAFEYFTQSASGPLTGSFISSAGNYLTSMVTFKPILNNSVLIGAGTNSATYYFESSSPSSNTVTNSAYLPNAVQSTPEGRTTGASHQAASFPALPSAGNAILVYAVAWQGSSVTWPANGVSDNQGNTYSLAVTSAGVANSSYFATAIYYSTGIGSPSGTFTVTATPTTSAEITVTAVEYSGIAATNALDKTASNYGSSNSPSSGTTAITTQANELVAAVLGYGCASGVCSASTPLGYAARMAENDSNYADAQADDKTVSSVGAYSANWTTSGVSSNNYFAAIATFKAAPIPVSQTETIHVVPYTWIGGASCSGNWPSGTGTASDQACWQGGALPGTSQTAHFDGNCTTNCSPTLTGNIAVGGIWMHSTYAGTISPGTYNITTENSFEEDGGTLAFPTSGSSGSFTDNGTFALTGGIFTAPDSSGSFTLGASESSAVFTVSGSPTFNANGGTVTFGYTTTGSSAITVGSISFNHVTFSMLNDSGINIVGTMTVKGNLTISNDSSSAFAAQASGSTVAVAGNVVATSGENDQGPQHSGYPTTLLLNGTSNQSITGTTDCLPGSITIDNTGTAGNNIVSLPSIIKVHGTWLWVAGSVNTASNTLDITSPGAFTVNDSVTQFNNVTFNAGNGSSVTVVGTLNVTGTLALANVAGGGLYGGGINLSGNLSMSSNNAGTTNITFVGGGAQTYTATGGTLPGNTVTVNKTAGTTLTMNSTLAAIDNMSITSGILDLNGNALETPNGQLTAAAGTTIKLQGGEGTNFNSDPSLDPASTVIYYGTGDYTASDLSLRDSYGNLVFNGVGGRWAFSNTANGLTVSGNLTITNGTLNQANNTNLTIGGSWSNSGAYNWGYVANTMFTGSGSQTIGGTTPTVFNGLQFDGSGTYTQNVAMTAIYLTISAGATLSSNGYGLTIGGPTGSSYSFSTDGTYIPGGNTVTLIPQNNYSFSGINLTFFNLVMDDSGNSAADTVSFQAGSTYAVTNSLSLKGNTTHRLKLRSGTTGSQWNINPSGTFTASYVDVEDSNNIGTTVPSPSNSLDSGDNAFWGFTYNTPALVQNTAVFDGACTSCTSAALGAGTTVSDLIVVVIDANSNTLSTGVTDNGAGGSNTYTKAVSKTVSTTGSVEIWYAVSAHAMTQVTVAYGTNKTPAVYVYELSGTATSNPLDQKATGSANPGTALAATTPTTNIANEVVLSGANGANALTSGGLFTDGTPENASKYAAAYKITNATGAYGETWTQASGKWCEATASFRGSNQ